MKILFKALLWSTGFEILLLAAVFVAHHVHLGVLEFVFGVLCYLALYCHAPAVWLLRHFPAAQENLVLVALVQWFLWFLAFGVVFALSRIFHKLRLEHEAHAA